MIYTNTPGSAFTIEDEKNKRKKRPQVNRFARSKTAAGALAGDNGQYRVANSTWTPEQFKAFNAPVYKADRRITRGVAGIPAQPGPQNSSVKPDLLKMALEKILAKKTYSAPGFTGAARAARIHTQQVKDQRRTAEQLQALAGLQMQEKGAAQRATIQANRAMAAAKLSGQYGLQRQAMAGENQQALETMRQAGAAEGRQQTFSNQQALEKLRQSFEGNRLDKQVQAGQARQNMSAALQLLGMGIDPQVAENIAGTIPGMTPQLSAAQLPEKKAAPPQQVFIQPKFSKKDDSLLPGTGVWTQAPPINQQQTSEANQNPYQGTMDLSMAKNTFNSLSGNKEQLKKYLISLKQSNPELYNALRMEVEQ